MVRSRIREIQIKDSDITTEAEMSTISGSLQIQIDAKPDADHLHDDRYYTESEVDTISGSLQQQVDDKPDADHTHTQFDELTLSTGATINEFSTDTTLSGNSDNAVPTEKAVKTYVDAIGTGNYVPVGSIITSASGVPFGYLECDGSSKSTSTYPDLFAVIGYMYGGSGASFNIPDYRGEFLRGFAHGDATDPDRAGRTDRGDGTTGDAVGTKQANEFQSHAHTATQRSSVADGGAGIVAVGNAAIGPGSISLASSGGNESRPTNIYVIYCIRYFKGSDAEVDLDHGGLRGLTDDDHSQYLLAAGSRSLTGDWDFGSQTISGTGDIYCNDLFTSGTLGFVSGTTINEFSTDEGLQGASNEAVPTERAVKVYIDTAVSGAGGGLFTEDGNNNIVGGTDAGSELSAGVDNFFGGVSAGQYGDGSYNVAVGEKAMAGATGQDHDYNVAIGAFALDEITTADNNIAIGMYAGTRILNAAANVYIGRDAGSYNKAGGYNVGVGYKALEGTLNQNHSNNIGIGFQTGLALTTGGDNVFMGYNAGLSNTTGASNVFIGREAGYYALGGAYNIMIGRETGKGGSGYTCTSNIFMGFQTGYSISTGASNVYIGHQAVYFNQTGGSNVVIGAGAGQGASGQNYSNNTFVGYSAGLAITTGGNNTFVGYNSGYANTAGAGNIFIGYQAGRYTETGNYNTVVGYQAGFGSTSNNYAGNIFMGYRCAYSNTTGNNNSIIGYEAGRYTQTGTNNAILGYKAGYGVTSNSYSNNTLVGYGAGYSITTGGNSVVIGYQAGFSTTSGTGNVFIGYEAGYNETGSNKLYIDNSNTATPLIYGDFDAGELTINGSLVLSTGARVDEFSIDEGLLGASNEVIPTERAVKVYIDTAVSGAGGGLFTEDANNNIVGGDDAGSELSAGTDNFFGGDAAGRYGDGSRNIGIGTQALEGTTSQTVNDNIGIGYQVGTAFTTADNNVLIGSYAGYTLATGDNNVMIGYEAGYENVKLRNTFIGHTAGRNLDGANSYETVAIGYQALLGNTSASDSYGSVAIGANALKSNQSSWYVVAIGFDAAQALTTPNGSVFIGYQAGYSATTLAASIMIGYKAGYFNDDGSYAIVIGYEAGYGVTGNDYDRCILMGYRAGYKLINTGDDNILIGHQAGFDMTTVNGTVVIGSYAGYENTTGDKCVYIGYEAGRYNDSDSKENTGIGYQSLQGTTGNQAQYNTAVGTYTGLAMTTANRNVLIGHSAGTALTSGDGHVFLGILAGASQSTATGCVYIGRQAGYYGNGNYNIGIGYYALEGTTGQNNANNVGIGYQVGLALTTGGNNVFIGYRAGYSNTSAASNVFVGYQAGYTNAGGTFNVCIGANSGFRNAAGSSNTCIGYQAGNGTPSNDYTSNTFVGYKAGFQIETGGNNVAVGDSAGYENETGGYNVSIGKEALKGVNTYSHSNNAVVGYRAGFSATTGSNNVALGYSALYSMTTADNNVAVGYNAGYSTVTGTGNVFIGYQAGYSETGRDKLYIDNSNTATPLIYGDFDTNELTINGDLRVDGGDIGITTDTDLMQLASGALTINGTLGLLNGTTVNEFSTDTTLSGNSDNVVPTEKAVKTYVDEIGAGSSIPVGAVIITASGVPLGYLECNGLAVSRSIYSDLFAVIGEVYGVGDGSTTFNLPDYRGEFLRGFDHGAGTDPDAAGRTDRGDGITGDNVGTKQEDSFQGHGHAHTLNGSVYITYNDNKGVGSGSTDDTGSLSIREAITYGYGTPRIGLETRPTNVNVMYCIRYFKGSDAEVDLDHGGLRGLTDDDHPQYLLAGVDTTPTSTIITTASGVPPGYLECDGSAISKSTYSDLYSIIGEMYGGGGATFNIPDYRGEFLRGFAHGDATDPDRAGRTNRGDGTTGDNIGTKQGHVLDSHAHPHYYAVTIGGNTSHPQGTGQLGPAGGFEGAVGGNETRPTNVYVMYCIKY